MQLSAFKEQHKCEIHASCEIKMRFKEKILKLFFYVGLDYLNFAIVAPKWTPDYILN